MIMTGILELVENGLVRNLAMIMKLEFLRWSRMPALYAGSLGRLHAVYSSNKRGCIPKSSHQMHMQITPQILHAFHSEK